MEQTNALRQLPEIQNIAEYLRNMEFRKKLFGGVDVESVLEHFSAVTLQYEAIISAFMQQAETYARRLAEVQAQGKQPQSAAPAPQQAQPQPQQWYGGASAYPQVPPMQPYADPWAQQPAPQAYNPWAQQPVPLAYDPWAQQADGLPPGYPYG